MKARLFIGNLASTVTEDELKGKFDALLASHKGEADVGNVEVRCKNENNYFGFVDVHLNQPNSSRDDSKSVQAGGAKNVDIPIFLRKYIDLMNNTKWKGSLIKVQLAKESFIEKLRREQQENQKSDSFGLNRSNYVQNGTPQNDSEQSRNQRQANDILYKLNRSKERRRRGDYEDQNAGTKVSGNCGFEVVSSVSNPMQIKSPKSSPVKPNNPSTSTIKKEKKSHGKKSKSSSSSSEEESDDDVRDGIPKFKGLLFCYPDGLPEQKTEVIPSEEIVVDPEETQIQQKLLSLAFENDHVKKVQKDKPMPPSSNNKSAINFKKNKQQQSDLLRLQSIEKMKELNTQRKNVIKSALSSVTASAPVSGQRKILDSNSEEPTGKKSKMALFDDDDDDDSGNEHDNDNEDAFKVKKQFEGAGGQKLLELKTRWGNDDRFKIDDRFKDSDGEEDSIEPMEQEKEKQYDILTGILGKVVSSKATTVPQKKGTSAKNDSSSLTAVIMPRYDPEAEDENEGRVENEQKVEEEKQSAKSRREKKNDSADGVVEKSIRSTEPATFKTVSNLKALFSTTSEDNDAVKENTTLLFKTPPVVTQQSSFSLLATFGKSSADDSDKNTEKQSSKKSSSKSVEAPRTFWQSNPFRYDSSDDEGEGDKVKVTIKSKSEKPPSSSLVIHGKTSFFFTENDARFNGLEDYFLHYEENTSSTVEKGEGGTDTAEIKKEPIEDFALKRQELKSIVKAKIRNTRRKDEKRTLAIKRAIRKRKRKVHQRGRNFS